MFFASDNAGPVHPAVMEALNRANDGFALPYGACDWTEAAISLVREVLDLPDAAVHLTTTGTSANAIALAALSEPWRRTFCSDIAHVHIDEWGAPAFYGSGSELALVPQIHGQMKPHDLDRVIMSEEADRRGPVSITQVTEAGTVYSLENLQDIIAVARKHDLPVHMDGARLANATARLGCKPAELTSGLSALSFGATKNGCMGVEAIVMCGADIGSTVPKRRYRGGHTISKHRYLAAQIVGYLENGIWLELAHAANAKAAALATALAGHTDLEIVHPVEANLVFVRMPEALVQKLMLAGADMSVWDPRPNDRPLMRLVCDWSIHDDQIDRFLELVRNGG